MAGIVHGFRQLLDNPNRRAVQVDPRQLQSAVAQSQQFHEQETNVSMNIFSEETTALQLRWNTGALTALENQPLDEFGRSRKVKFAGEAAYTAGFPIFSSGQARGSTFIADVKMSVQIFNDQLDAIYSGDFRWLRNRLLASIFLDTPRVFDDVEAEEGEVTIYPFANGDEVQYSRTGIEQATAGDNHYLAFPNPIDDANNPLPAIRQELIEHPYNTGEVVVMVSSSVYEPGPTTGIHALTGFVEWENPTIDPALSVPQPDLIVRILRPLRMTLPPSATYRGRSNLCHIVEWPSLPSGYGIALTTGGPRGLKRRVDVETELRGFKPIATRRDFPYMEDQWLRRMGFGAYNRVALVIFAIGQPAYTVPAIYVNIPWS